MAEAEKNESITLTKGELNKLMAEAAKSAAQEVKTELLAQASKGGTPDMGAFAELFERMAMSIAEVSDQGTARKRVAPEVLANRAKAHEYAVKLLVEARDKSNAAHAAENDQEEARWTPEYRVVAKTYLSERMIEPWQRGPNRDMIPTEISWRGMPNNSLRPINDVAKAIFAAFQASIGTEGLLRAEPSFMTPGGVTIRGEARAASRRTVPQDLIPNDLEIVGQKDPTAPFVRVLGTIASPARQNVARRSDQVL